MEILNLSPEIVTLENGNEFNYGTLNRGDKSKIRVQFKCPNLVSFELTPTCGCTVAKTEKQEDGSYISEIAYDTQRLGLFGKTLTVKYREAFKDKNTTIKIKGEVK